MKLKTGLKTIITVSIAIRYSATAHDMTPATLEPSDGQQLAEMKNTVGYDAALDAARKATMGADELAWEATLEKHLGGFYLPLYKKAKETDRETAWDYVQDDPSLPRVLIIGDSISRGYTLPVRHALAGEANVHRAPANCGPTAKGLRDLDEWIGDKPWDLIFFNFGIHDRSDPEAYGVRLEQIIIRLKKTGARLVFANTTPLPEGSETYRREDGLRINETALPIVARHGISVCDFFSAVMPVLSEFQNPNDCHFNNEGYMFLGELAADAIRRKLVVEKSEASEEPPEVSADRTVLRETLSAEDWTLDGAQMFEEESASPAGGRALRVECDFTQKETAAWSKTISSDLLDPEAHGALAFWSKSPDLLSLEIGLTRQENGREVFYRCLVPLQPGKGWIKTVVPFEELRLEMDSVAGDPSGFTGVKMVAYRPVITRAIGDGKSSGTVRIADLAFIACPPREAQSFPKEVQKQQVEDVVLPAWDGALGIKNMPWDAMIRLADSDPELAQQFDSWRTTVANWADEPLIKRAGTWEEVVAAGWVDSRAHRMEPPQRDRFAVALASGKPWHILARRLPLAAFVARQSGDPVAIDYLNRQLAECATWFPLQMQGWTLNPPPEGDGPWLTECYAMIPLALAMNLAGEKMDPEVRGSVLCLIQKTVDWIERAWREQIPWYVRGRAYQSNQWALPAAALSLGCLVLEEEGNRAAYELGVRSVVQHLYAQGESGSFAEGYGYGDMTMQFLMPVLWMMDRSGDQRLSNIPFMKKFSGWYHQMNLPGKKVVNFGDSQSFNRFSQARWFLLLSSLIYGDPAVLWGNERFYSALDPNDLFSVVYQAELENFPKERPELPVHAWFADQQLMVWRTGWSDDDVALWVKGGTLNDHHYHADQGHISVMNGKELLLLDPGSVSYGDPDYELMFKSCAGHNILQTASGRLARGRRGRVPVTVERMDSGGGAVEIDGSEIAFEVRAWKRRIEWTHTGRVTIEDHARLFQKRAGGEEWFRWHTGSTEKPEITQKDDKTWSVAWPDNALTLSADRAIVVDAVAWRNDVLPEKMHYGVVVSAAQSGAELELTSELLFPRPAKIPPNQNAEMK